MKQKVKILFSECEHSGDLDNYCGDITKSGGSVISSECDDREEVGTVIAEVDNDFMDRFENTDSWGFVESYIKMKT